MANSTVCFPTTHATFRDSVLLAVVLLFWRTAESVLKAGEKPDETLKTIIDEWRTTACNLHGTGAIWLDTKPFLDDPALRARFLELIGATEKLTASFGELIPGEELNPFVVGRDNQRFKSHPKDMAIESIAKFRALMTEQN